MTEQRYSEKRVSESFTIYVLFSEPLEATFSELIEAAAEDYPGLDWTHENVGTEKINTRDVTMAVDFSITDPKKGGLRIVGMPGRCEFDWQPVIGNSCLIFPNGNIAVDRHTDHMSITVNSPKDDTSVAARFDAARRMTCLGAVLAKLPIALGVYFPNGDTLVQPHKWVEAADTAMKGEIPVLEWMTLFVSRFDEPPMPLPVTVSTIGLAAFNGHEIVMPRARMDPGEAAHWVYCTVRMLLEADNVFVDGDTLGVEAGKKPIRIRHVKEGTHDAQTDQWCLLHASSDIDEAKLFGPRPRPPAPEGYDNSQMANFDTLKNKLYAFHAK